MKNPMFHQNPPIPNVTPAPKSLATFMKGFFATHEAWTYTESLEHRAALKVASGKWLGTPKPLPGLVVAKVCFFGFTPQKSKIDTSNNCRVFKGTDLFQAIILGIHVSFWRCIQGALSCLKKTQRPFFWGIWLRLYFFAGGVNQRIKCALILSHDIHGW